MSFYLTLALVVGYWLVTGSSFALHIFLSNKNSFVFFLNQDNLLCGLGPEDLHYETMKLWSTMGGPL